MHINLESQLRIMLKMVTELMRIKPPKYQSNLWNKMYLWKFLLMNLLLETALT